MKPFKIFMIGESGCGKTSILRALKNQTFSFNMECTIGIDYYQSKKTINDFNFTFDVYDTSGCYKFEDIVSRYLEKADLVLICYDVTNSQAIVQINKWLSIVQNQLRVIPAIIVANKCDLPHHPNQKILSQYFNNYSILYTSARSGEGVQEIFDEAYLRVINQNKRTESSIGKRKPKEINKPDKPMSFCC